MIRIQSRLKKWVVPWVAGSLFLVLLSVKPSSAEGLNSLSMVPTAATENIEKELSIDLRKRAEWVEAENGDAKITLQYASNSGELSVTQDMNVVLIHDKSGSMDVNYGYHLGKVKEGWGAFEDRVPYPILNDKKWSETILEDGSTIDLESEGAETYLQRINQPNRYTTKLGADKGYIQKDDSTLFYRHDVYFNSPCQLDQHYYLVIKDDERSEIPAWRMVHGKNLYNIENTDLHHYVRIEADHEHTMRENALALIDKGYRVIRMTTDSVSYYSEKGETKITEPLYFLDVSTLEQYEGKWILNTCAKEECSSNDRLTKSQTFMSMLVSNILSLNPENKIAYIPFWGDVPKDGSWKNYKGNDSGNGVDDISHYKSLFTYREGTGRIDFTSDPTVLHNQINHPFTYHGTNWANAFQAATEFLNARSAEDQKKETLVLFLTDGMPQGTEGQNSDYQNPAISGIALDSTGKLCGGSLLKLKEIENVTVWAVGVGINELDSTGIKNRLEIVNDDGRPFYARYTADFEALTQNVLNKIHQVYSEKFYATNAFYHDELSEYFELDQNRLDEHWEVLEEAVSEKKIYGVPENVYALVKDHEQSGIKYVYAKENKTIYWYLGTLTNGGYTEEGHSLEIPLKFLRYEKVMGEKNQALPTNVNQFITYHTTLEPDKMFKKSIETPKLLFHREDSELVIRKNIGVERAFDMNCRFVCSKQKYQSGTVQNIEAEVSMVISAGTLWGEAAFYGLEDGKYYIYEVDKNNQMISSTVHSFEADVAPRISTMEKNSVVPWAITKSDEELVSNRNNYLSMGGKNEVAFEKGGELTIIKEIEVSDEQPHWDHGNPIFMVRVRGLGIDGNTYEFYHTFEFTKEYVDKNKKNGTVCMSYTFYDLPLSNDYVVEEVKVGRYHLGEIIQKDGEGKNVGIIEKTDANKEPGFYQWQARVDLVQNPEGIQVFLYNEKVNESWFNHITCIKNNIKTKVK